MGLTVFVPLIYLLGLGGGDDVGLLATGCCDLSINTLALAWRGAGLLTGLGGGEGALAIFLSFRFRGGRGPGRGSTRLL